MLIDLRTVAPGDLPNDVFEELIAGNNYSPEMVCALRDHLVYGADVKDAVHRHGVHAHKLRMRLEKLRDEIERIGRINSLLSPAIAKLEEIYSLSTHLAAAVDSLRSSTVR
ncbi:TPA: hypothetical protein L6A34_31280 [Pseudomonas aeruginosa]|jgi:hypothetical protein|uniref:hypothetical protein n=1 Tax=Pseudomonas aeruginosa TaxID=287 RepID=UPI00071B1BB3|nr:hypothetical protein [Pseudomonas aeruginosa]ELQ8317557.1 hypothetical protein [Pseudomonas aeruginosa]KSM65095.1 hypothetical protein APA70_22130 [Pseudomonas aeruginosa]HBP5961569.1 hypothetical protein [Pseudomonas aeruginosa]HBP6298930.1 hypothetical protein [Pseudomonas aeruginosa]HBP6386404.1 hypothetical protein [Pseudomonas aeruginosa]